MKLCCPVLFVNAFWLILSSGVNMVRVHYSFFGEWYDVILPDLATAKAFACDFVDYRIQKIGDDFCVVNEISLNDLHGI